MISMFSHCSVLADCQYLQIVGTHPCRQDKISTTKFVVFCTEIVVKHFISVNYRNALMSSLNYPSRAIIVLRQNLLICFFT